MGHSVRDPLLLQIKALVTPMDYSVRDPLLLQIKASETWISFSVEKEPEEHDSVICLIACLHSTYHPGSLNRHRMLFYPWQRRDPNV